MLLSRKCTIYDFRQLSKRTKDDEPMSVPVHDTTYAVDGFVR